MGRVLKQSFKYTAAQTIFREIASQAQQAIHWVTDLNDAVNSIAVVTGKTGDQITRVTEQAIKGSRELRVAAREYAEGALIFYQQGLNDKEVQRRNEITIKAAKAAGQSIQDMSQQLTAVWNTYGMVADQQERAASIGAKMAAQTAVDFKDIAEAMQIAAAPASQMGVAYESLAAIIATVGDTTQQSASVIGNAFKTIFSRMEQLKIDGTDGEVTFKAMSQQLAAMGIALEDTSGDLLSIDKVIEQVGNKWDTWSSKQQLAVAQLVGGTRQYGQFLALMQNYDKYLANLRSAQAEGVETLNQQYKQALDSIESRAENAAEAWHRAFSNAFDAEQIKDFYKASENVANVFGVITEAVGGLPGLLALSAVVMRQKILPTGRQIGSFVRDIWEARTTEGRQKGIRRDFASQRESNVNALAQLEREKGSYTPYSYKMAQEALSLRTQQIDYDEKIALANERINTELNYATGARRVQLELAQEQLKTDREIYNANLKNTQASSWDQTNRTINRLGQRNAAVGSALSTMQNVTSAVSKYGATGKAFGVQTALKSAIFQGKQSGIIDQGTAKNLLNQLATATTANIEAVVGKVMYAFENRVTTAMEGMGDRAEGEAVDTVNDFWERIYTAFQAKGKQDPGSKIGKSAETVSRMAQRGIDAVTAGFANFQVVSNFLDTFNDTSATTMEKLGSLTGAMGTFGMTLAMIPGPLGWITAGLTTLLPLLIEAVNYSKHRREREIENINTQLETIDTETAKYKAAQETAEKAEKDTREYNVALIQMAESEKALREELKDDAAALAKIFRNGKIDFAALEEYAKGRQDEATTLAAEGQKEQLSAQQAAIQGYLERNGFTGDVKSISGSSARDIISSLKAGGFEQGALSDERLTHLAETILQLNASAEITDATLEEMASRLNAFAQAETLSEVDVIKQDLPGEKYGDYATALLKLAESYDNAAQEADSFQKALMAGKDGLTQAEKQALALAEANLRASIMIGESSKTFGLNAKSVDAQAKQLAKQYSVTAEAAAVMAIQDQRLNKGLTTLNKSFGDWKNTLLTTTQYSQDYNDVAVELGETIGDLINAAEGFEIPDGFDLVENLPLIEAAATGDSQALLDLGEAITIAQIKAAELDATLLNGISEEEYSNRWLTIKENAISAIEGIREATKDLDIGASLADSLGDQNLNDYINALNEYAMATGMTADEMNHMLSQVGVKANVVTEYVPQTTEVPEYTEYKSEGEPVYDYVAIPNDSERSGYTYEKLLKGHTWKTWTVQTGTKTVQGVVPVAQISTGDNASRPSVQFIGKKGGGSSPKASGAGGGSGGGGGKGGGGGSAFKPKNAKSQANTGKLGERYTNTQSRIDKISRSIDRLSAAEADAWGGKAYRNLQGINTLLAQQAEHLQLLQAEATGYLTTKDKPALDALLSGRGMLAADYNSQNFVQNRQTIIDELEKQRYELALEVDRLNALYDANGVVDEALDQEIEEATNKLTEWEEYAKEVIGAIDQVDETAQKVQDVMKERVEQIRQWLSHQLEMAQLKLDLKIAISDTQIKQLEHLIDLWGDLGTQMNKTWWNYKKIGDEAVKQADAYIENANTMRQLLDKVSPTGEHRLEYEAMFGADAWAEYVNGHGGHPREVIDQLQSAIDAAQSAMWEAQEKLRSMLQEWIKLFQHYMSKFDDISSRIAQSSATLDMYVSILNATGRNYTAAGANSMANISRARYSNAIANVRVARGRYALSKSAYGNATDSLAAFQAKYGTDVNAYSQAELITYQQIQSDIKDTKAALDDALTTITNGISEMASAMTEALESSGNAIATAMFENIGGAFADNTQAVDLFGTSKEVKDYFLDALTKNYELNKLAGSIQAYIDDNTLENMERYTDLLHEVNAAQEEGVELTQTDLEILQKKFELEQAVDAYEEQQRFKNTMRLARDASGNWSYVYSGADNTESQMQQLEQNIKDNAYQIAKLQQDAAQAAEEAWIQTWSKIYELEKERGTARYQQDEQYRAYIDNMLMLEEQKLERYKDEIIKRYGEIDLKFEDSNLHWVMGTEQGLDDMQSLHDYHLEYLHNFGDDVEANADELIDNLQEDVTKATENIDELEGDYTNLEDLIDDKTADMIDENKALQEEIDDLVKEGTTDLEDLSLAMRDTADNMIDDLNRLEDEIRELLELLEQLRQDELDAMENGNYDESRNYAGYEMTDLLQTGIAGKVAGRMADADEAFESWWSSYSATEKQEHLNKLRAIGDLTGTNFASMTDAEYKDYVRANVFNKVVSDILAGNSTSYSLTDPRKVKSSASGNYFRHPGITTIAENEPEIVLNPEDTRNILAAVRYVRLAVNNGLSQSAAVGFGITSRNASIGSAGAAGFTVQTPVQQGVQIDANFPNVNVAAEVESALDMLILQAAQYAGERQ